MNKIQKRKLIKLKEQDYQFIDSTFKNALSEITKEMKDYHKYNNKRKTYFSYHRKFIGLFDQYTTDKIIKYFVENYSLRTTLYCYRLFTKHNYVREETGRGVVYSSNIETKSNRVKSDSHIIKLDENDIQKISKIRTKYLQTMLITLNELSGLKCNMKSLY